jgi:hypothetical protein
MNAVAEHLGGNGSSSAYESTVFVLTADHGQHPIDHDRIVFAAEHPELYEGLMLPPTGDPRATYLHVRDGFRAPVGAYLESHLADSFHVIATEDALSAGLWGPGEASAEVRCRLGDFVVLAKEGGVMLPAPTQFDMMGGHGGLTPDEALIPWIAWRLDV